MTAYKAFQQDSLQINVYEKEEQMGQASAALAASYLNKVIAEKGEVNLILATGTSQFTFLESLKKHEIDWKKITVFHLDEYIGISAEHPSSFRRYLLERILREVNPKKYYLIEGDAENIDEKIREYASLLKRHPIDLACMGIGENGHIAFNDPPVADFYDPQLVKQVELDEGCRKQQYNEGWFPSLDTVPTHAITLTIPAIMNCEMIICNVPGPRKREAVRQAILGPISTACPASILRQHPHVHLFLDRESLPTNLA
ncbi:MAG: glucosamine-6-phosphate deaminase [Chitinophagaceae bacterium]|nr:glucosamine-6-phosphate deaminase [Chitinophagaceae bacterium]